MRIVALKSLDLTWFISPNLANLIINNLFELNASKTKTMIVVEVVVVVVVVVVGQIVESISSKTLAYDCLYTFELCTASMIATS